MSITSSGVSQSQTRFAADSEPTRCCKSCKRQHISSSEELLQTCKEVLLRPRVSALLGNRAPMADNIVPHINVFRWLSFHYEKRKHCYDLSNQLKVVSANRGLNPDRWKEELRNVPPLNLARDARTQEQLSLPAGFVPLSYFLDSENTIWTYCDWNHGLVVIVVLMQCILPLSLILAALSTLDEDVKDLVKNKNSYFDIQNFDRCWHGITLSDDHVKEQSSKPIPSWYSVMGCVCQVVLFVAILLKIKLENCRNRLLQRLPRATRWLILGNVVHVACVAMTMVGASLILRHRTVFGMPYTTLMLSLLPFIDEIAIAVWCQWTGKADLKETICQSIALLAYCPLNIQDIISDDTWEIETNADGDLLVAGSNRQEQKLCVTRIMVQADDLEYRSTYNRRTESFTSYPVDVRLSEKPQSCLYWRLWCFIVILIFIASEALWVCSPKHCSLVG